MISELKEKLSSVNMNTMEQLFEILELPDEQFNVVYPQMKTEIVKAFSMPAVRNEVLKAMSATPITDLEKEMAALDVALEEVKSDSSLSENKKDFIVSLMEGTGNLIKELFITPREQVEVKIQKIHENAIIPTYAHSTDAGADIYAIEDITLKPHETVIVPTGLKVAIPSGYEIQIRPRSGLSLKTNLRIANAPGTIDAEYRGEVGVIVSNTGNLSYTIKQGDKIAQMVIMPVPIIKWSEVTELDETKRGEGGYGSTDEG